MLKKRTHGDNGTQKGSEQGSDQTDQTTEYGDGRGDDVGEENTTSDTSQPDDPVLRGVVVQVLGSLQGGEEDPLGRYMGVQDSGDQKRGKTKTVGDPLDGGSSTSESGRSDELTTEVVDDDTDGDVETSGESLTSKERTSVKPRVLHLGHDGQAERKDSSAQSEPH